MSNFLIGNFGGGQTCRCVSLLILFLVMLSYNSVSVAADDNLTGKMVKMCLFYPAPSGHARSDPIITQTCPSDHVHTVSKKYNSTLSIVNGYTTLKNSFQEIIQFTFTSSTHSITILYSWIILLKWNSSMDHKTFILILAMTIFGQVEVLGVQPPLWKINHFTG